MGSAARFLGPRGITTGGRNLYVADTYNNTIHKIVIDRREVTTIAGGAGCEGSTDGAGSAALFRHPYGIVTEGNNLCVADTDNHTIRKLVLATDQITTIAGYSGQ
jgi:DNA-binding beta-propeller fold protein YncE